MKGVNKINQPPRKAAEQIYYEFRNKGLTPREAEVARLACSGRSNKEIAEELVISETTVKKHMQHIFEKLEIGSREELRNV
ncbi:MAG: helix-turn-helix transcriptional regulator [Lachnospira sp.]|nr:helix-turn-helix transcriptional regulator [Lachnospira sp.]